MGVGFGEVRGRKTLARRTLKRKVAARAFAAVMARTSATRESEVSAPATSSAPVVSARLIEYSESELAQEWERLRHLPLADIGSVVADSG